MTPARQAARARKTRRYHAKRTFGMTLEEYEAALQKPCAICGEDQKQRVVDHDHATGLVRGTLCISCNRGIGFLGDSAARLEAALLYLTSSDSDTLSA